MSFLQIFWHSGLVVKLVLMLLLSLSVGCWAIIFFKNKEIRALRQSSLSFLEAFQRSDSLETLLTKRGGQESPLSAIFREALSDLLKRRKGKTVHRSELRRRIEQSVESEEERLEKYVPFLATTGSAAPFIGLFGTVWGIMAALWQMGKAGSTSLAVVGPHLGEALIATAFGLAAAIPAVIFYNYFVGKIRALVRSYEVFGEDLLNRIDEEYNLS